MLGTAGATTAPAATVDSVRNGSFELVGWIEYLGDGSAQVRDCRNTPLGYTTRQGTFTWSGGRVSTAQVPTALFKSNPSCPSLNK